MSPFQYLAIVAVLVAVVAGWIMVIRDHRRGVSPCPNCGRLNCDRGCTERGED